MLTINQYFSNKKSRKIKLKFFKLELLDGAPHRRGVVFKVDVMTPRKPNSAKRKIVKVRIFVNDKKLFANVPGITHSLQRHSWVYVEGGSANDLPGVDYSLIRCLQDFKLRENFLRKNRRSKMIKLKFLLW